MLTGIFINRADLLTSKPAIISTTIYQSVCRMAILDEVVQETL